MNDDLFCLDSVTVSIVLPCYNEADVLRRLVHDIDAVFETLPCDHEIIFVNDGSTDASVSILDDLTSSHTHVRAVHFSRNFGHQSALHAGLVHASGDAVVVMDSDLQDTPAAIPQFLLAWQSGYNVVYAVRIGRKEAFWKRFLFYSFYRVLNAVATTRLPADAGNFCLMDRGVVDHILSIPDSDRYFPGLRSWVGFRQTSVPVERYARHDDQPRVSLRQLFSLAKTAIFGFSRAPLSLFYAIAAISMLVFAGCSIFALYHRLVTHLAIPGWTSITMIVSLFGALNALGVSVLGEYVVRIYDQVRQRPSFVIARRSNFHSDGNHMVAEDPEDIERVLRQEAEQLTSIVNRHLHDDDQAASSQALNVSSNSQ